jgi:hypothetical protein
MLGGIPLLPQYVFMAWCLVKHRGNFILLFKYDTCQEGPSLRKFLWFHFPFRWRWILSHFLWHPTSWNLCYVMLCYYAIRKEQTWDQQLFTTFPPPHLTWGLRANITVSKHDLISSLPFPALLCSSRHSLAALLWTRSGEILLWFNPNSFVFPSHTKKPKD